MSDFTDWDDPFADDEAARERERRRAEREARRRAAREGLGSKVSGPIAEAPREAAGATRRDGAAAEDDRGPASTRPPADRTAPTPPAGAGNGGSAGASGVSERELWGRRAIGAGAVILLVVLVGFLGSKLWGAIGDLVGNDASSEQTAPPLNVENFVIPEGYDRHQIAGLAQEAGLKGDYEQATKKTPRSFPIDKYAPEGAPSLEGFLFPATYELEKNASVDDLVAKQLDAFQQNLAEVDLSYAKSKNLNVYDVLKIASMIEREVQVDKERKLVAEVIYNRLSAGMALGIDATIRYEDQNYDEQLLESRLNEDTPYNTRTNTGLPPTPIGNPGLASIEAAANPAKGNLLYFVVKPGTCGHHVFLETDAEFQQASAEYQAALEAEGGSPTDCN